METKTIYLLYCVHEGHRELIGVFDDPFEYLKVMNHWAATDPDAYNRGDGWEIDERELNIITSVDEMILEDCGLEEI